MEIARNELNRFNSSLGIGTISFWLGNFLANVTMIHPE
jgi:hypothetical protein